eukprot:869935-Amphidinium_carterae.2
MFEELMKVGGGQSEELAKEAEKWKAKAKHYERECNESKKLNSDMQKVMQQMTQVVSERADEDQA